MRRSVLLALLVLAPAIVPGCGYKLAGGNSFLPERIRVIGIAPFQNLTRRPEIEQRLTEEVAREFSKRGGYRVLTTRDGSDAWLEGAVADLRTQPVQFNDTGRATRLETAVRIQATLRDLGTGEILWSQDGLVFREQYDVSEQEILGPTGVGAEPFFDRETLALEQIARGAAGALVTSLLEGF